MRKKSGVKVVIIIFMLILLIIGLICGGAYVYITTDLFKTPEQLFKKYLLSNVIEVSQLNFEPFNEINERSKEEVTAHTLDIDIDPSSILGGLGETEKVNAKLDFITDFPNKNKEFQVLINNNDKELFRGNIVLVNETLGISIPDLYDKFVSVENRDFKKMAKTFNLPEEYIEIIPDKLTSIFSIEDEERISQLLSKYGLKIMEKLDENNYIIEKDININVNSKEMIGNKYTLAISTQKIYGAITNTIKELLEDPEFLELCKGKIPAKELEEMKTSYNNALEETPTDDIEDKILNISLYAVDGRTVKTELTVDKNEAYFIIENNENESIITFATIEPKSDTNEIGTTSLVTIKNKYANNSGELTYEIATTYNKDDINELQAEYDAKNSDYREYFNADYSEVYSDQKIKYIIKTKKTNNDTITAKITFEGDNLEAFNDFVNINFKCQFGKNEITMLNEENSVAINDYTMEDYSKLLQDITTNATNLVLEKPYSLMGMIMANFNTTKKDEEPSFSEDIYSEDYTAEKPYAEDYSGYEEITFPDDGDNNNYLYPTTPVNIENLRNDIDVAITNGLNEALNSYKVELMYNPEANLGDFLTVENVQKSCGDRYNLELPEGSTIKCTISENGTEYIYYALMNIDGDQLVVTEVEVLTEEEYLNR
ncbi:MAG: hypothetical protein IKL55_00685 [Clostridia bacterium]|nr:hypothetical protein [Clostridia bacterium]